MSLEDIIKQIEQEDKMKTEMKSEYDLDMGQKHKKEIEEKDDEMMSNNKSYEEKISSMQKQINDMVKTHKKEMESMKKEMSMKDKMIKAMEKTMKDLQKKVKDALYEEDKEDEKDEEE